MLWFENVFFSGPLMVPDIAAVIDHNETSHAGPELWFYSYTCCQAVGFFIFAITLKLCLIIIDAVCSIVFYLTVDYVCVQNQKTGACMRLVYIMTAVLV